MSTLEQHLEARYLSDPLREALAEAGDISVQEAAALVSSEALPADLVPWRDEIVQAASTVRAALRDAWVSYDPTTQASPHFHEPDPELQNLPVETGEFCDPDSLQSMLSPARYLMQIYNTATRQIIPDDTKRNLDTRRPDLKELALTSDHMLTEVTTLSLANQVMETLAKTSASQERDELYRPLSTDSSAFSLPFDWYQTRVRVGLAVLDGASLNGIARATGPGNNEANSRSYTLVPNVRDRLGLCDEDMKLLTATTPAVDTKQLWLVENFLSHTSISLDELNLLICSSGIRPENGTPNRHQVAEHYAKYINLGESTELAITVTLREWNDEYKGKLYLAREGTNATKEELGNMERMVRLYRRTGLPFHELDHLICAAASLEDRSPPLLNDFALSLIARYREWHARFALSVDAYAGLIWWSNSFVREGVQETSYLRQLFGDDAKWIAEYCGAKSSELKRFLRKAGYQSLTANEIAALQRGLQLTQTDWDTIVGKVDPKMDRTFDWDYLAALQRLSLPFRSFGWSVPEAVLMLDQIAPWRLPVLSGTGEKYEIPAALDQLVWLNDTLTTWQATPAQIVKIVQTPPLDALKATQETANWINDLYQNLLPALLTVSSFDAFETVPLDTPTAATSTVTIDWLTELKTGSDAAIDANGLVQNKLKSEFEAKVQTTLTNKQASQATSVKDGVVATLLLAQASAKTILSAAVAKVMSGAGDAVIPMLAWMNLEGGLKDPIHYYTALTKLLTWNLQNKQAIDVSTLNQQPGTLQFLAFMSRYAEAVRLFRLEKEDIQLVVERSVAFGSKRRQTLPLDFGLLLALGQLKGLQHDQASADAWRMYFTRQADVGSDVTKKEALTASLSQLLGCPVDELKLMLNDLPSPLQSLPDTIREVDLMHRHLVQARALALDYAQLKPVKTMATRIGYGAEGDAPTNRLSWAAKRTAADAVLTGVARHGASATAVKHPLDESCRDALVGYLLKKILPDKNIKDITSAEQLYGYLLLDVNVSSEVSTTQLLEAIGNVQLYITRALEGAEPATFKSNPTVSGETSDLAKRKLVDKWAVDREYQLWRANQELELYPAHYVDPEWIQGASPDYLAFAEALNQGRLEDDTIRQALTPYLSDLSNRGRATIGGLSQVPLPDTNSATLYLTARTPGDAGDWYLRSLTLTASGPRDTGPWEKIDVGIPREEFSVPTPILFKGAIYVVWAECDERPKQVAQTPSGDNSPSPSVDKEYRYRVKRVRRLGAGRWDEPEALTIQKVLERKPDTEEATEIIVNTGPKNIGRFAARQLATDRWILFRYCPKKKDATTIEGDIFLSIYIDPNLFGAQFDERYFEVGISSMIVAVPGIRLFKTGSITLLEDSLPESYPKIKIDFEYSLFCDKPTEAELASTYIFSHNIRLVEPQNSDRIALKKVVIVDSTNWSIYESDRAQGWIRSFSDAFKPPFTLDVKVYLSCKSDDIVIDLSPIIGSIQVSDADVKIMEPLRLLPRNAASDPCFVSDLSQASSNTAQLTWRFDNYDEVNNSYAATDGSSAFVVEGARPPSVTSPNPGVNAAIAIDSSVRKMRATPKDGIKGAHFSLSFWFRTIHSGQPLLSVFDFADREWLRMALDNSGCLSTQRANADAGAVLRTWLNYKDNAWHHVVYTCSLREGQALYMDGRRVAASPMSSPLPPLKTIELAMFDPSLAERKATRPKLVELAELKLFDHALSQAEIGTLLPPPGVALRLCTETAAQLREHIEPTVGEPPFLYKATNYKALQSLQEHDASFLIASYNASAAGKLLPITQRPFNEFSFSGYDGSYGWELFLYMPWLVAKRLANTGDYDGARQWLHRIFDPTCEEVKDRWICRPLRESMTSMAVTAAVTDPDAIARVSPIHYRTAIVNAYTDVLIATGDAQYRNPSRESLSRAKMYYVMATEVRGPRPLLLQVNSWDSPTLAQVKETHFKRPVDEKNLAYWDTLEARLDNLRHSRSIDGLPLNLPLLAPPVNPATLQQAAISGGISAISEVERFTPIPHYRFAVMLEKARGFVITLSSLGNALQQTLERDDSEALGLMQLEQQAALTNLGRAMQHEQIEMAQHTLNAMQHSRTAASERYAYYHALHEQGVSAAEQAAMDLTTSAGTLRIGASVPFTIAGVIEALPNIFGLAVGGQQPAGIPRAIGTGMLGVADMLQITADRLVTVEQYRRRRDDWQLQYQQAEREGQNLDEQIAGAQRALAQAQDGLKQQLLQQEQTRATQRFLQQRFGSRALYRWMSGRLATLYWQAYDSATNLCRQAEAACQYELGNFELRFIHAGQAWNDQFRGLLAGEALLLDLQRMELAYRQRNFRPFEVVKTFSLKALNAQALATLKSIGSAQYELQETLFDQDYPDHYLRQFKTVALSFPAVLGPYQEVGAMLTQLSNTLYYTKEKIPNQSKTNLRAYQQVALSQGINDSGLFQLDFNDERYLPFEGTGVASKWKLTFPGWQDTPGNAAKTLLESLDDVIIQVRYTAIS
ncbi:neuraminidase-like domain-containing protein [Pseudomonas sp. NFIX28]|uniref:Tc toxin subunit A-related protein n=1 Tax=Pseudomonas sp. NFIX28 TaxID=1566235 RepID=UPI00089B3F6F|nr:neuraminidase-like domain-containing protein [Pseudomonas sp. NFIX28]SDZ68359.1 Concanavalin A-like lectin/glucanases superfamily protein [Pseudomonas sp. NFIX28]